MATKGAIAKERPRKVHRPRVDVVEKSDAYVLQAELPGLDADAVELTVEKDGLTIQGKVPEETREGYRLVHGEYAPREFSRSFVLSDGIDRDNVRASMKNGILTLTLPKAAPRVAKQIPVDAA